MHHRFFDRTEDMVGARLLLEEKLSSGARLMWCEILQRKISSPKAIIHAYSPKCIRFSKFLPHTTSALRAPSPQGEGFDLCKPAKLRNKSECVRVTRVQFTLSALRAPLPKGEARACANAANGPTNRNSTSKNQTQGSLVGCLAFGLWVCYFTKKAFALSE